VQRLFSTFADGWPGGGILLLRLLAGAALIERGVAAFSMPGTSALVMAQIGAAAVGLLLLGGLWTPVAGVLAAMVEAWIAFTQPGAQPWAILLAGIGISLAMIGPGAWSVDAQLYGRKQIVPPEP
jgi:uncharacterized membrane protein YphA (DoxX/SURF4 family)